MTAAAERTLMKFFVATPDIWDRISFRDIRGYHSVVSLYSFLFSGQGLL